MWESNAELERNNVETLFKCESPRAGKEIVKENVRTCDLQMCCGETKVTIGALSSCLVPNKKRRQLSQRQGPSAMTHLKIHSWRDFTCATLSRFSTECRYPHMPSPVPLHATFLRRHLRFVSNDFRVLFNNMTGQERDCPRVLSIPAEHVQPLSLPSRYYKSLFLHANLGTI